MLFIPLIFAGMAGPRHRILDSSLWCLQARRSSRVSVRRRQHGQPDNLFCITHNNTVDLKDFFALTGADGTRIIHQIVFVAIAVNQGPLSEHSLLVSGHFDQPRLFRSATDGGAAVTDYRSVPVLVIQPLTRERGTLHDVRWLAILDSRSGFRQYLQHPPGTRSISRHVAGRMLPCFAGWRTCAARIRPGVCYRRLSGICLFRTGGRKYMPCWPS